jgi:hypothetical protein
VQLFCLRGAFLLGCWVMRATGKAILLAALGVGFSPRLGVSGERAVNFSLSSGMLLTGNALIAALVGVTGSMVLTVRLRHAGLALG